MRESSGASDRVSCAEAGLLIEKKISEEMLSEAERQALENHLNFCTPCSDVVRLVSVLPLQVDDLSETEILAARYRFVAQRARLKEEAQRRKMVWGVVGAAAAVVAAIWVGWLFPSSPSSQSIVQNPMLVCVPAAPSEPVPGVVMTYCDDKEPGVLIENGGDISISLRDGSVGFRIDPKRRNPHRVAVNTPQGEVRVKGTVFTVHVNRDSARVEVFRGVVEFVSYMSAEPVFQVSAGRGADLIHHRLFDLSSSQTEPLRRALEAIAIGGEPLQQETVAGGSAAVPGSEETATRIEFLDSGAPDALTGQTGPVAQVETAETDDTGEVVRSGMAAAAKRSVPTIDSLIQEAQSCLIDRDWTCAAARYQDVLKHYPGRPESTAVLISLAKIELLRLHLPKKALDHYNLYQRQAPRGPMAEEALFGIAEACRRLGKRGKEEETLRLFVEQYPKSSQLEKARARLRQLEEN